MVNVVDQDFYNVYRLAEGKHSQFTEIFPDYSPQEVEELRRNYQKNEKKLKSDFKKWIDSLQMEKWNNPSEIMH